MHWKVKAKLNHIKFSDANTKYYHTSASIRRNRNLINIIQDPQNNLITHPKRIEECITSALMQRFLANPLCSFDANTDFELLDEIVSHADNLYLCIYVTFEEGRIATFDLAPNKALGQMKIYHFQK